MAAVTAKPFAEMTLDELRMEADDIFRRMRAYPEQDFGFALMCGIAHRLRQRIEQREREQQQAGAS